MPPIALLLLLADTPSSTVLEDGRVQVQIQIDLPPEQVRERMGSPAQIAGLTQAPGIQSERKDGACWLVHRSREMMVYSIDWHTKACPTESGLVETLVRGDGMEAYQTDWQVLPNDTGSLVVLRVHTETSLPVPLSVVQSTSIKECEAGLRNLKAALESH